ncbi:YbaK/EbsC family protein [Saccharopolyspora montiporae]|uniref:YbaK/EbsC family protein n=1 Tax=Saccharopolyspora montiporae TaxID=2781240 RepID=UPI00351C6940
MHAKVERVQQALQHAGVDAVVRELPDSTRSAQDAAAAVGAEVAQIAKSLVFLAGDELVLVITSGANRVSPDKLQAVLGIAPQRPDAATVKQRTGFSIGGVPPIGHTGTAVTFLDQDLLDHAEVWAAAGTPNAVFAIDPRTLGRIAAAMVADVAA